MKIRFLILCGSIGLLGGHGLHASDSTSVKEIFHPEPLDLAKAVGDAEVLLVADDHTQPEIKNFLGEHLQVLQSFGFRTLGIEMLPAHCQADLDSWDVPARQRIQRHLKEFWEEKGAAVPMSILRLIEEAKRQGFTVIAIDSDHLSGADRQLVNSHWVESIERCRRSQDGSRMIVFGGASHFRGDSGTVPSLLKGRAVHVAVLEFSGLERADSINLEWKMAEALQQKLPIVLQISRENDAYGRHGLFMVSEAAHWVINLEPHSELALLPN